MRYADLKIEDDELVEQPYVELVEFLEPNNTMQPIKIEEMYD